MKVKRRSFLSLLGLAPLAGLFAGTKAAKPFIYHQSSWALPGGNQLIPPDEMAREALWLLDEHATEVWRSNA